MPHNRTRLWVGAAIVAVTIPAVGTYYYRTDAQDLRGTPITVANRRDATDAQTTPIVSNTVAIRRSPRDYEAELNALLARQGTTTRQEPLAGSDDDPNFDVDVMDDNSEGQTVVTPSQPADPTTDASSDSQATVATMPGVPVDAAPDVVANVAASGELSDGDVYRIVASNLSGDDRDDFVRAYAVMTPDQRADLIDGFRDQIESGTGR